MLQQTVLRALFLSGALVLGTTVARADEVTYSDNWSEETEAVEVDPAPVPDWGVGVTEVNYGDAAAVDVELYSPLGNFISSNSSWPGNSTARADVYTELADGSEEGDYTVNSAHWLDSPVYGIRSMGNTSALLGFTRNVRTRYYYVNTIYTGQHQYSRWFCNNRCQKQTIFINFANETVNQNPPPYLAGVGYQARVLFFSWCSIALYAQPTTQFLRCEPPN